MNQSPSNELEGGSTSSARSPLLLLLGLIVVAALAAILITSLGGDDEVADTTVQAGAETASTDETSDAAPQPAEDDPEPAEVADAVPAAEPGVFGGVGIPEVDAVEVAGDVLPSLDPAGKDSAIGRTAPVTTATDLATGERVELGAGKARVIGFFAHWCPHCQAELPELTSWLASVGLPADAEFVAVSTVVNPERDNYPPSAWFTAEAWPDRVVVDDGSATLLQAYGFTGFPAFIAIDADGNVVERISGNVGVAGFEQLAEALS